MEQHSLFSLPEPEKRLTNHTERMKHALEVYASRGLTLETISGPKILGRKVSVLKWYCRKYLIAFPDFTPMVMREKKERGKKS